MQTVEQALANAQDGSQPLYTTDTEAAEKLDELDDSLDVLAGTVADGVLSVEDATANAHASKIAGAVNADNTINTRGAIGESLVTLIATGTLDVSTPKSALAWMIGQYDKCSIMMIGNGNSSGGVVAVTATVSIDGITYAPYTDNTGAAITLAEWTVPNSTGQGYGLDLSTVPYPYIMLTFTASTANTANFRAYGRGMVKL